MNDRETILAVALIVVAYWWFVVKKKATSTTRTLKGRMGTGASGTAGGGGSKQLTTHRNSNARTNPQQGTGYTPAPIASVGVGSGGGSRSNVGTPSGSRGVRSGTTRGLVGSFISPTWPTRRITSAGAQIISSGQTQVPSYSAIPLTLQGPGGGGSLVH